MIYQTELGPGRLDIGPEGTLTSFASQLSECALVPKHDEEEDLNVLSGEIKEGDLTTTWTIDGNLIQDFGTEAAKSLSEWTITNNGKRYPFKFVPNNGGTKGLSGELQVRATKVGGKVKKRNESDLSFKVIGQPVITALP